MGVTDQEVELVRKAREGDGDAVETLASIYGGVCSAAFARYSTPSGCPLIGDPDGEKFKLIWDAARTFREDGGASFPTWLTGKVKAYCMHSFSSEARRKRRNTAWFSDAKPVWEDNSCADVAERAFRLLDSYRDPRAKRVFELRYGAMEMSYRQIGREMGFCRMTAKKLHDDAMEWLRREMRND